MSEPAERPVVLVVEDDDAFASDLRAFLQQKGCDVERATDGAEALLRLRREPRPKLVLLDLLLPGMDGWHFYAELRKTPSLPQIPIVVLTGTGRTSSGGLRGIVDFVRKPVGERTLHEFHRTIEQHLQEFAFRE
jgi:CheY-like chemotaxis protein